MRECGLLNLRLANKEELVAEAKVEGSLDWENCDCLTLKTDSAGGILSMCTNTWWEGVKQMLPDSFQWYPVKGQGAVGTNGNTRNSS